MEETAEEKEVKMVLAVDPSFRAPPPDPELLKECRYVLLRHAITAFNVEFARIGNTYGLDGEEHRLLKVRRNLIDPQLLPEGILQCEAA
jgi:hypothetical protein